MAARQLLVFTDLDGTLLDHHTYRYEAARPALAVLRARGVPLMIATSKTRAEVVALRAELSNEHPFVVENGGAVYVPPGYFSHAAAPGGETVLGIDYGRVRETVVSARARLGLEEVLVGFGDLDAAGVAALTGLPVVAAARALQRASSEPLRVEPPDAPLESFLRALDRAGLAWKRGGRFLTVQGPVDKAHGVRFLAGCFRSEDPGRTFVTAALGDSRNDLEMLRAVDIPVVIPPGAPGARRLEVGRQDAILPDAPGPEGFRMGVEQLLARFDGAPGDA